MALLGLGYQSVTLVKCDEFARMDMTDLAQKLAQAKANNEQVLAIVATAGTTDAGAIDPLREIVRLAAEQHIWVHVDAAWGGALLLSEKYRHYRMVWSWWIPLRWISINNSSRQSAVALSC